MTGRLPSMRSFLFMRQEGLCYLGTTPKCQARERKMRFDGKRKNDYASKEHVIPDCKRPRFTSPLILLACCNCNNAKGAADPTEEQIALARQYEAEWQVLCWSVMKPKKREKYRQLAEAAGLGAHVDDPHDMLKRAAAIQDLMRARRKERVANQRLEREAKARKEALGLNVYEDSTKTLSKLRRAVNEAMGR